MLTFLEYNHFEIVLSEKFSDGEPPPGRFINQLNVL